MDILMNLFEKYNKHKNNDKKNHYIEKIKSEYKKHSLDINNEKHILEKSVDDLSDMFNTVLLNLSDILEKEYKNDIKINLYNTFIKSVIEKKKKEPISVFLLRIYKIDKYRINILKKKDDFFLNPDNLKESINGDNTKLSKLFIFADFWNILNENLKEYIRNSCITMVKICENYIDTKAKIVELTEINELLKHS